MLRLLAFVLAAATTTAATTHTIDQKDRRFSTDVIRVKAGDEVQFVNNDSVTHNVFSTSAGNAFNLKRQAPGTQSSVPMNVPGTVQVRCAFHPTMKLAITVE